MAVERPKQMMRVSASIAALSGLALLLAACGSSNLFSSSALDLFNTSSKATTADAGGGPDSTTDVECPGVSVRTGAATMMIGSKPVEGEPSALDLRYQVTIVRTARECQVNSGIMNMKVGIEGRVITGPAGGPGTVDVPLRIAVVQEGVNPEDDRIEIWSGTGGYRQCGRPCCLYARRLRDLIPDAAAVSEH